ncbi:MULTISPECIES: MmcQ/YjbR family DNA-binding protein [Flavobacterium]|jgi:predicted DNA-binding protein (MmcQ/YjbR family)|uniref:MmcQ/YjbR family DNA-binding protein n=1 Tax=Flavobacterium microcysteis TaxID=2596891 RepID=A0A501Q7Q3_9FLAO|nr:MULTISPECIES: MmcQ/YjbR family DNA-binding protein [Flavobacterium]MBU7571333.1 MmcQ/YjbR family DNA-binding protein [Flavobacterium sp.]PZO34232.1 MAG: MmcQ/YjbR family DNA-binding protein [Flavobacteriaceae bacterium]PZQ91345.1 MAG: MmcQ/YjbR family DNA-binding protein [Flavobacterium johnsoniae]KQS46521.1 MmcQ-like protein [Flavobacterium sp. Leaf359]MBL7868260.1 MmcQ/YjbR family DNA-binding protein [Flavobacterium lindanitolerans]
MNIQAYFEYCLSKKGVTEHFPFDEDTLVFKVGGKMFALSSLSGWEKGTPSINLKCDPERAEELRAEFDDIKPGYHMSKVHWNTVSLHGDVTDKMVRELIDHSYDLVFKSLTKKIQTEIIELKN